MIPDSLREERLLTIKDVSELTGLVTGQPALGAPKDSCRERLHLHSDGGRR
jgi:hypothetical protein